MAAAGSNDDENERRRRRRRRRRKDTDQPTQSPSHGSVLFTVLLLGLLFCLVDVLYIFIRIHGQVSTDGDASSRTGLSQSQGGDQQYDALVESSAAMNPPVSDNKAQKTDPKHDKQRILDIIEDAGLTSKLTPEVIEKLPTWSEVVDLIGPTPRVFGLDSCQDFQNQVEGPERFIAPAGIFNSGTNLMAELLIANCANPERQKKYGRKNLGVRWQVNWGKHQPPKHRLTKHAVYDDKSKDELKNENILPIVTVRHPYSWLQSMCRHRYATHWFHEATLHCPNLVPNEVEREFYPAALDGSYKRDRIDLHKKDPWLMDNVMNIANFTLDMGAVPVYVKYKLETTNHLSLVHFWNDWFNDYYHADFPRVMVRFEDLIFYGKEVTEQACTCMGGQMAKRFKHIGDSAKKGGDNVHGSERTTLIDAIIHYGKPDPKDLTKGMTADDYEFAKEHLSKEIMDSFGYEHPERQ